MIDLVVSCRSAGRRDPLRRRAIRDRVAGALLAGLALPGLASAASSVTAPARAAAAAPQPAANAAGRAATSTTRLDTYLTGLTTLRVEFTQSLEDSRGRKVESLAGTLLVVRPGKFRWEVRPAAAPAAGTPQSTQLMVADGRNVWFYDRELEQVTVKPASSALTATPALLLSGVVELRSAFEVVDAGARGGLAWVKVKPKRGDAEFREARLAFEGGELRRMEIDDKLGQTAALAFGRAVRNGAVAPGETTFTPPPGVDVIGTPAG